MREKLIELIADCGRECHTIPCIECDYFGKPFCSSQWKADHLIANGVTIQVCARPLEEWGEDYGNALWWKFPIEEPPYVGSPLDEKWPAYHTHWTPILVPQPPKGE